MIYTQCAFGLMSDGFCQKTIIHRQKYYKSTKFSNTNLLNSYLPIYGGIAWWKHWEILFRGFALIYEHVVWNLFEKYHHRAIYFIKFKNIVRKFKDLPIWISDTTEI